MKSIFCFVNLYLLFSFPFSLHAQLRGEYVLGYNGFGYESILFLPENKFEYKYVTCTHWQAGKGTYLLTKDSLSLHFDSDSLEFKKEYANISTSESDSSHILIHILAVDMRTNSPLEGLVVFVEKLDLGAYTDAEGKGDFIVPKSNDSLILKAVYIEHNNFSQKIKADKNYDIQLFMKDADILRVAGGRVDAYKIVKKREKKLVLIANRGNKEVFRKGKRVIFRHFRRLWYIFARPRTTWRTIKKRIENANFISALKNEDANKSLK